MTGTKEQRRTITVRVPEVLFRLIEDARGRVPREPWLRDVIEAHLMSSSEDRGVPASGATPIRSESHTRTHKAVSTPAIAREAIG